MNGQDIPFVSPPYMMKQETCKDVAATPMDVLVHDAPTSYQVVHFALGLSNPIHDLDSLKSFFSTSIMLKIPRFSSLLVIHPNGKHYWRKTEVNIDDHFIIRRLMNDEISDHEDLINGYLAKLATASPMSTEKPLWEIHVLVDVKCVVLRVHHSIGDGTCLASLVREIGSSSSGERKRRVEKEKENRYWRWNKCDGLVGFGRYMWLSTVFCLEMVVKSYILKDKGTTVLTEKGYGGYYRPHKVATARFNLDDVKLIKNATNATLNDVICGIIWVGFLKYIDARTISGDGVEPKEGQQITGILMANLRRVSGLQEISTMEERSLERWWGNKTGVFFMPMKYTKRVRDALWFVKKSKSIMDKKKHSGEPRFSYQFCQLLYHIFGVKGMNYILTKPAKHVTFGFSNVMGPTDEIFIDGNPVTYIKLSVSSLPMGIVMHLLSYMKNLELQILAAESAIPDPNFLATCFIDTLQEMVVALESTSKV